MNTINKFWFCLILLAGVLSGCVNDDDNYRGGTETENIRFTFTLPESIVNTRGVAAEDGENKINDLTLLFFEPTTNETGRFVGHYKVPAEQLPAGNEMEFSLDIVFENGLSKTNPYSILAMANMKKNYLNDMETSLDAFLVDVENMTQGDVVQYATMNIQGVGRDENDDSEAMIRSNLPMSAKGSKGENEATVAMKLVRTVSRFDVINNASAYVIESVSIWNAFTVGSVWEGGNISMDFARTERYYGLTNSDEGFAQIRGGLYAYENVSVSPEQNDSKTTCLIFGIRPSGSAAGTNVTYYRLNVSAKERGQYLKRNNVYQITISGVNGTGENTEYDAYKGGKFLLDVSINAWDRDEDGLIIRDGDNLLTIPTRKAVFTPQAEERQYYVYTMGIGTLEMEYLDMPSGMNAWLAGNNLFISVTDYAFEQRKGSIELKFAGMSGIIEIVQSGKTEKYLTLSHTTVPTYPAGSPNTDMVSASPILITSSGAWTAKIYNGDYFSFNTNTVARVDTKTGVSGHYIHNIYTFSANADEESRTAFVLISLDEDPDNYRNVIVLTQAGTGGFTLSPNNNNVSFEPNRTLTNAAGNTNVYTVQPSDEADTWTATIEPGVYADKFTIVYDSENEMQESAVRGTGTFSIMPAEVNYTETYTATVLISLNRGAKTRLLTVTQGYYGLTVSPTNVTGVAATGGSGVISVTSPGANLTWSAVVTGNAEAVNKGLVPYFSLDGQGNPVTAITGRAINTTFNVIMPGINTHLTEQPKATVVVTLDGTAITKTITVTQNAVTYIDLHAQTIRDSYGSWGGVWTHFNAWRAEMIDGNNFGPTGTVYAKSAIDCGYNSSNHYSASQVLYNARIFNVNHVETTTVGWTALKENQYTTFVLSEHNARQNVFTQTGFTGYTVYNLDRVASSARTISTNAGTINTEIYKYLFNSPEDGGGPWGPVDAGRVTLRPYDGDNSALSAWPDTFIPLIYDPNGTGYVVVGVDPSNKMIFVGDTELFSKQNSSNYADSNSDNAKFLRNLISWMVHINNYGKPFSDRFKNDRSR